jgi:two-component system chemotaxis sensor kinase CheA
MSIDMSQFHQVFFEECFEGLEAMESGLLSLDIGDIDPEVIRHNL